MRVCCIFGIMMAAALSATAERCPVNVIMQLDALVAPAVLQRAERSVTAMLAEIDVDVRLRAGSVPSSDENAACGPSIVVALDAHVPASFMPGALAYARPFAVSGTRIHVFIGRIVRDYEKTQAPVLAHVLVHEIAHVLQGTDRHSDYGIMKASWNSQDFWHMRSPGGLPFTDVDIRLIHGGIPGEGSIPEGSADPNHPSSGNTSGLFSIAYDSESQAPPDRHAIPR